MHTEDVRLFRPKSYFQRYNKHGKIPVDEYSVGLYGLRGNPRLLIPYHRYNNLPMLFDVVSKNSVLITMHTTLSSDRMCTSVRNDINQNLTSTQK